MAELVERLARGKVTEVKALGITVFLLLGATSASTAGAFLA